MPNSRFEMTLKKDLREIKRQHGIPDDRAFLYWFSVQILELTETEALEAISVDGSNDKGIDIFWIDNDNERVVIGQGKHSLDLRYRAKERDVTKLESSLNWLATPEALRKEGRPALAGAAEDYIEATQSGYGVELFYIYTGPKSTNVDKHIRVYNQNPDNIEKGRTLRHFDRGLIETTWEEIHGETRRVSKDSISIVGSACLEYSGSYGEAVVASVSGSELARLHSIYNDRLFDRNVRLFLGTRKGSVNAGIIETLKDDINSQNFWAFNNGITILCDEVDIQNGKINLKNFSIINGCQTTVSIAQHAPNPDEVEVLTRFIAAPQEIVDDLIRYNNSQNPIRTWDIASQDKTQRRLESEFKKLKDPYIYLTRRGSRPTGNLSRYRDENRRLRQIRIDVIGQYAAAFRGFPVLAYKDKAVIFSKHRDEVFPTDVRTEEVLFQWICGELCVESVRNRIKKGEEPETSILKRGGVLFVMAILSRVFLERNGGAYLAQMKEENITSKAGRNRLKKYVEYCVDLYVGVVNDLVELGGQDLYALIRSRDFYEKVRHRVTTQYNKDARAENWLREALPSLVIK